MCVYKNLFYNGFTKYENLFSLHTHTHTLFNVDRNYTKISKPKKKKKNYNNFQYAHLRRALLLFQNESSFFNFIFVCIINQIAAPYTFVVFV